MNTKVKIVKADEYDGYQQLRQISSIEYSPVYINNKGEYCEAWYQVKCRDKLNDLPQILHLGMEIECKNEINGFYFDNSKVFKNYGPDFLLSLSFDNIQDLRSFRFFLYLINNLEERYNLKKTEILETQLSKTIIVKTDMFWVQSVLTISLYSFLLRIISYEQVAKAFTSNSYISLVPKTLEEYLPLFVEITRNKYKYDLPSDTDTISYFLLKEEFSIDKLMKYIPKLLEKSRYTGGYDELLMEEAGNKYVYSEVYLESEYEYKYKGIFKPFITEIFFNERVVHESSGFISLISQVKSRLTPNDCSKYPTRLPIWVMEYLELLYKDGYEFEDSFKKLHFKVPEKVYKETAT